MGRPSRTESASSGFEFGSGSVTLTFRYDDALASAKGLSEGELKVWRLDGSHWSDMTGSIDTNDDTITTVPVSRLSQFAVSKYPPAPPGGTVLMLQ